jgi:hypothetical protein
LHRAHTCCMPPPQALYRCHAAPVVFLGFLSDDASLVSLDSSGMLVLWPQHPTQRCGFGWLKPRARWQLPRMLKTCQLRLVGMVSKTAQLCAGCTACIRTLLQAQWALAVYGTAQSCHRWRCRILTLCCGCCLQGWSTALLSSYRHRAAVSIFTAWQQQGG